MSNKNIILFTTIFLLNTVSYSQSGSFQKWGLWGSFGYGGSYSQSHRLDGNLRAGITSQLNRFAVEYRYFRGTEIQIFILPSERINENSLLIGFPLYQNKYISLLALAGPSIIHGDQRDSLISGDLLNSRYSIKKYRKPGASFELQFLFAMKRYLGFGTSLNANVNSINSFIGMSGNVYFGRLHRFVIESRQKTN